MTGTAMSSAREFRKIYKSPVVRIPTNRPARRTRLADRVYASEDAKWQAIVEEIVEMNRVGRPVLVGTRTIEKSELLSKMLSQRGIEHQVLNAHHIASEAEIIADAGQHRKVTVATNMAGRGTDIKLEEGVADLGGLHVICTEIHDSARIDRQLAGRCGRQGDPGSTVTYLSVDDEILKTSYGPATAKKMADRLRRGSVANRAAVFKRAQRKVERRHLRDRMILLHHEKQRKKMQHELGQDPYLDTPS
jgi:preprotein translocase subunit SecA